MKGAGRQVASIAFIVALVVASGWGLAFGTLRPLLGLDLVGGVSVTLTAPSGTDPEVLDKTVEVIRGRVDALGVAEPDITRQGELNVQVQIPRFEGDEAGGRTQERLLELIGRTAQLEYRLVEDALGPEAGPTPTPTPAPTPEGTPSPEEDEKDQETQTIVLEDQDGNRYRLGPVLMTGDVLTRAQAVFNDPALVGGGSSGWVVAFQLNDEGSDLFAQITRDNVGRQLAIVLDRTVESAPTIQTEISNGRGEITGGFAEREAKDLALVLRTGALPVELARSEVQTVSPSLGRESLDKGLAAGIAGLVALCVYLAFYYRLLGVVTWFGMAIWAVFALALVSLLGRSAGYSLTLAGVAGLVVALGITADSYIVFYERLKDEVRHGKTLRAAVVPAFKRAWKTIVAADIVTITAAVVLYLLAIGSVRGFALTLGLATLLDMFVVYFFKRPTVYLMARSGRLSNMRGIGLRSGVAAVPDPVTGR